MKKQGPRAMLRACLCAGAALALGLAALAGCDGPQGEPGVNGSRLWEGPFRYELEAARSEQFTDLGAFSLALRGAVNSLPEDAGAVPENPVALAVEGLNLSEPEQVYILYSAITRYMDLDLQGCRGTLLALTPGGLLKDHKKKLLSLRLPETLMVLEPEFADCSFLSSIAMPGLRHIDAGTFSVCPALTSVTVPRVNSIGEKAFASCTVLETLDLSDLVSIGNYAFQLCAGLETVRLPRLESLGIAVFNGCSNMTSADFPNLRTIGTGAFTSCNSLRELGLGPTPPDLGANTFRFIDEGTTITFKVPADSIPAYEQWSIDNDAALGGSGITRRFVPRDR